MVNVGRAFCAFFCAVVFLFIVSQSIAGSAPPLKASIGSTLKLDATDSLSEPVGEAVSPQWEWASRPASSVAEFSDTTHLRPTVTVDVSGTYVARLSLVNDAGDVVATSDLSFGTENLAPVAQVRVRGMPYDTSPVALDGSASFDVEGQSLSYLWSIEVAPAGSTAVIAGTGPMVEAQLDIEGEYRIALRVQDADGATSVEDHVDVNYLPNGGTKEVYRLWYDNTWTGDAGTAETFDLGDRLSVAGTHDLIEGFVLADHDAVLGDTLAVTLEGVDYTASSASELLALVDVLQNDADGATFVQMSRDDRNHWHGHDGGKGGKHNTSADLTFVFGDADSSVTLSDIVGKKLKSSSLKSRGVEFYQGVGDRNVAPVASGRFDQLLGVPGEALSLELYASSDVDGDELLAATVAAVVPDGAAPEFVTDIDGMTTLTPDLAGDYLVVIDIYDGQFSDQDHVLVVADGSNLRPVAQIEPTTAAAVGMPVLVDGRQL